MLTQLMNIRDIGGEGIERIMEYAFANCVNLTLITIPNSVSYIDELAFDGSGINIDKK